MPENVNFEKTTDFSSKSYLDFDKSDVSALGHAVLQLPDLATPAEVAALLRCTPRFVQEECKRGRLGHLVIASRYTITPDHVRDYLLQREKTWQRKIVDLPLNGARNVKFGKSFGLNQEKESAKARAQAIATLLKKSSSPSCRKKKMGRDQQGRLIHLSER